MTHSASEAFFVGVNYPWVRYGQDFGRGPLGAAGVSAPDTHQAVAADFERIRATGATVVRWFLLCDGRSGLGVSHGIPSGPDDSLFADVAAALELAEKCGLRLCFSLLDFPWLQERGISSANSAALANQNVLKFAAGREALLENVLIPLFRDFRAHPALFAWEIANEPEWAIREFSAGPAAQMHLADFRAFAAEIAEAVHEFAQVPVTLGSARLIWLRAWSEIGLDLYQAHYFPQAENDQKAGLAEQLASFGPLDKPLFLGALPWRDPSAPGYSLESSLDISKSARLGGAVVWRWREPEERGDYAHLDAGDPQILAAWLQRNASG